MNTFQGVKSVLPPIIDSAAAELEIPGFEKEMSSAKLTFEMDRMKASCSLFP